MPWMHPTRRRRSGRLCSSRDSSRLSQQWQTFGRPVPCFDPVGVGVHAQPSASHSSPKDGQVVFGWGEVESFDLCFGSRSSPGSLDDIFRAAFCDDVSGCLRPSCVILGLRHLRLACGYHYFAFFFSFCYIYLGQLRGLTTVSRHDSFRILPPLREPKEREQNGWRIFHPIDGDEPASIRSRVYGRRAVWAAVLPFSRAPGRRKTPNVRRLRKFTEMIQIPATVFSCPIPHGWRTDLLSVDPSSRVHRRGAVRAPSVTGQVVYHSRDEPKHSVESCHHQEHIHNGTRGSSRSEINILKLATVADITSSTST
ncbi:hypothetical protein BKA56DRAFT_231118 [Ilyonectria sp. MPI-CAGE-AT-0026]|nr:hypothetical protein BKA56DRAFT_231118 [Ilyonectria sp. MPI-CAGE-AT-0026]